jgi:Tol biopolymer transport system component
VLGVIALSAGALAVIHLREKPAPADPVQFTISPEENSTLGRVPQFAISPDGRQLVFVAAPAQSGPELWVRTLATLAARRLPGTESGSGPFWSPDGRYIGFWAGGKLKKIDAGGGPPIALCDAASLFGGTWNRNGVIVFAPMASGPLYKVDAGGGIPTPVTKLGTGETHRFPSFLPDGQHFLYLAVRSGSSRELRVASLGSAETSSFGVAESNGVYASGHLLFVRGGTLMAQPFDAAARRASGDPFPVAEQVPISNVGGSGRALFSVSATGVLSYWRGGAQQMSQLTWIDRTGKPLGVIGEAGEYSNLSLSPDERRVAVALSAGTPANRDIWLIDLARDATATRLTFDPTPEGDPIWSPDGSQVLFNTSRNGLFNSSYQHAADGGGQDVPVVKMEGVVEAMDWSHDGRFVLFDGSTSASPGLWVLPLAGDRKPAVFLHTPFVEDSAAFSPDDRWVAYDSNASGRFEVYVRSFSPGGGQFQISRNGGWAPKWRGDGKEIFFLALDGTMMAADVTLGNTVQAAVPHALFPTTLLKTQDKHTYTVTKDGKRFLLVVPEQHQAATPITVVLNWPSLVKK